MRLSFIGSATLLAAIIVVTGCAGIKAPTQTGFLSDYSKLEKVADDHLFYSAGRTAEYSTFIIDPVVLLFDPEEVDSPFTQDELKELQQYFRDEVDLRLSENDGYAIVASPGEGVARIRIGITDVKQTIGALNISVFTKVTGAGIGGASAEGEMVDSLTGEQLAAAVRWGGGSRLLLAGITQMGDAKIAINRWAKDMRTLMDKAHGKEPQ